MRPEHLKEALLTWNRATVGKLLRAVANLGHLGRTGNLPSSARWRLDSRLVFLRKPGADMPRPIRIGETWRRLIGMTLIHDTREQVQQLLLSERHAGGRPPREGRKH